MTNSKLLNIDQSIINKILIIQTAFIGDVILVTPLINAVYKLFPDAKIDVMVTPQTSNILDNNPKINSLILFDKKKNKFGSFFEVLKKIKFNKYDISFSPHSSITTAFLMYFGNIPIRVGFDRWVARYLLTVKIPHLENVHKIQKNLFLLSKFSDKKFSMQTELFPSNKMIKKAENILADLRKSTKNIISIAPGSNWFTKRWPEVYYKDLVEKLSDLNYGIVFIGSKKEKELCEEIKLRNNSINLAGQLSLLESAAVIKLCDLMICNDSGALHLADAMQTDVLAFFGPTVKSIGYYPFRESDKVLEVDLECRPCSSHGTNACPLGHHNCMKFIKPDLVVNAVNTKLL